MPLLRHTLVVTLALTTSGCSLGDDPTDSDAPRVQLSISPSPTLAVGDTARVFITERFGVAANARIRFSAAASSPSGSVAVDSTGGLTALAVGSSIISAEHVATGRVVGQIAVSVQPALRITPGAFTVSTRGTQKLTAAIVGMPSGADQRVVWSSADPTIATVTDAGTVTGVRIGITRIGARSAADPAVSASAQVTVSENPIMSVTVAPASFSLAPSATVQLTTTARVPSGVSTAVTFTSSDACVASVSATGLVTGLNLGSARITVASVGEPALTTQASVFVQSAEPVRLTIQSVTYTNAQGQQVPVDPANVSGVVTITINAGAIDPAYSLVELLIGGRFVASRAPSGGSGGVGVAVFVVNTAERDANGVRLFPNGATLLQARAHRPSLAGGPGCAGRAPEIDQLQTQLTLNNGSP